MTKTVSLETSKALKEAGYPEKAEKYWYPNHQYNQSPMDHPTAIETSGKTTEFVGRIAAPDVSELLEALPTGTMMKKTAGPARYYTVFTDETSDQFYNAASNTKGQLNNPAEALAALWLELRKRKLV